MTSLSSIVNADQLERYQNMLRADGYGPIAQVLVEIVDFAKTQIDDVDTLVRISTDLLAAEKDAHRTYATTATCREAPGVVAGHAITEHCAITCRNGRHEDVEVTYRHAVSTLQRTVNEISSR